MRLLLDAHASGRYVSEPLRRAGHDVKAIDQEAELGGMQDEHLLMLAAAEGRIFVTFDVTHFPKLLRQWAGADRQHAGVVLLYALRHEEFGLTLRGIESELRLEPAQEKWVNRVTAVSRGGLGQPGG